MNLPTNSPVCEVLASMYISATSQYGSFLASGCMKGSLLMVDKPNFDLPQNYAAAVRAVKGHRCRLASTVGAKTSSCSPGVPR